jgi:hypothetical protein
MLLEAIHKGFGGHPPFRTILADRLFTGGDLSVFGGQDGSEIYGITHDRR